MHKAIDRTSVKTRIHGRRNEAEGKSNPFKVDVEPRTSVGGAGHQAVRLELRRRSLMAIRARLRGEVTQTVDAALGEGSETTSASPDTAELATESNGQYIALGVLGSAAQSLAQIEEALGRIEDGSYGRCADCNAEIPDARLEAVPYAPCCVRCATRRELRTENVENRSLDGFTRLR